MRTVRIFLALLVPACVLAQDKWTVAEERIVRLKPKAFRQLPDAVLRDLERRRCRIPQTFLSGEPHNVIMGSFARKGQTDWAVLCSRNGRSSVIVYWNGSPRSISRTGDAGDKNFLQTIDGNGTIGFSRSIQPVGRETIIASYRSYGGRRPPSIDHEGIDDAYVEKASVILYFYRGRWIELQGAD
jgi:hypothetical protein